MEASSLPVAGEVSNDLSPSHKRKVETMTNLIPGRKVKLVHASTQVALPDTYVIEKAEAGKMS